MRRYGRLMGIEIGDIATWASAMVALGGSGFAVWESRKSRRSNDEWQRINAAAALRSANAAEKAQAFVEALHAKTEATAEQEARQVRWFIERVGRNALILRNDSDNAATGVTIGGDQFGGLGRRLPKDATIPGRGSIQFSVIGVNERLTPDEALVTWDGQEEPVAVPIPPLR